MRFKSLDSLRGIAALVVVVHHCAITLFGYEFPAWIRYTPLRVLMDGKGAVLVFFALSGFVLFHGLTHARAIRYGPYLVKRFMRLYMPFAFAVVASAVLYSFVKPEFIAALGPINRFWWQFAPSFGLIFGHFAMTDREGLQGLDAVMWSLCHEARISLIFPFIALLVMRNWFVTVAITLAISVSSHLVVQHTSFDWTYNPFLTLQYLFLFAGAAGVAFKAEAVRRWLENASMPSRLMLWIVALVSVTLSLNPRFGFIADFAAIALVALAFGDPFAIRVLSNRALLWLGKVSYSLYLIHIPILLACVHLLYGRLPLPAILAIAVAISLPLAEVVNLLVEKPCIELGRRFASALDLRKPAMQAEPTTIGA